MSNLFFAPARTQLQQAQLAVRCSRCEGTKWLRVPELTPYHRGGRISLATACPECLTTGHMRNSAEAWETLAVRELIPMAWVESEHRWFGLPSLGVALDAPNARGEVTVLLEDPADQSRLRDKDLPALPWGRARMIARGAVQPGTCVVSWEDGTVRPESEGQFAHPPRVSWCVALASDARGLMQAELLVREVCERIAMDRKQPPARVVWRVDAPDRWVRRHGTVFGDWRTTAASACEAESYVLGLQWMIYDAVRTPGMAPPDQRAARGAVRPGVWRCEELLRELFSLGYALDFLERDRAVLLCPRLEEKS